LKAAGIRHVAFKPGSIDSIRQVVNIAAANPDFPIILQWTGGRAGGHYSFEDFHQPILATYLRFLLVGVPYHIEYFDGVTDTVAEEDLGDEELRIMGSEGFESSGLQHQRWYFFSLANLGTYRLIFMSIGSNMRELKPTSVHQVLFEAYLLAAEQLLAAEDTAYFLAISQRPAQKPVPFIPVLES
jgi:enoyl reductase-like protein